MSGCGSDSSCQAACLTTAAQGQCPNNSSGTNCDDPGTMCWLGGVSKTCTWSVGKSNCTCGN
jgi:hypothetical protein